MRLFLLKVFQISKCLEINTDTFAENVIGKLEKKKKNNNFSSVWPLMFWTVNFYEIVSTTACFQLTSSDFLKT